MTGTVPQTQLNEKPGVFTHTSLMTLAKGIGKEALKGLELAMILNISATAIIRSAADITDTPLTAEGSEYNRIAVTQSCLLRWKELTQNVKTKDRLKSIERALREIGKGDIADQLVEHHQNNQELTQDLFK
ncbi:hypothetical protein Bpfe_008112 [Biomphalaria pfeifferi]|uniref:Death domain-containing protein n=1 Tax=Biomphalaria pfeifferi TaxID=112525 RepID=A0AAD8BX23_BIOPF|nr:hypothetical protein Bpfe_008112 [Biomphalaria pfeifferi]